MDIIIIAEEKHKDSWVTLGASHYNQYAIGYNFTEDEKISLAQKYRFMEVYRWINPYLTMRRHVESLGENKTFGEWDYFDIFENERKAVNGFGDSVYWKEDSISIHPLHMQAKEDNKKYLQLQETLSNLQDDLKWLKNKYNDIYTAELKSKKLYSKAKSGNAPQNVIDSIQARLKPLYEAELSDIQTKIKDIKEELESLG